MQRYLYQLYNKHTTHITLVTTHITQQHPIFPSPPYPISSTQISPELKQNHLLLNNSLHHFTQNKPTITIPLSNDILQQFQNITPPNHKKH
ncbi:hypothetical protein [Staphylococcus epidermidis]|uniref:hypothetical protein n=1 Tax=Staphylococcus epidermidis TaxID=1282 RepID=UPI0037D9BAD8